MTPVRQVRLEALELNEAEFVQRHPAPALVLVMDPASRGLDDDETRTISVSTSGRLDPEMWISRTHDEDGFPPIEDLLDQARTVSSDSDPVQSGGAPALGLVWVEKREGNPFRHMVTIGRVPNNDIVFATPTLSKIHAYLRLEPPQGWWIHDQRSTNGTWVDGQRLPRDGRSPLRDGSWINLGPSLGVKFFLPATLWAFLRGRKDGRKRP